MDISLLDPANQDDDVALTPSDYLAWAAQEKGLSVPKVPAACLFAFDPELLQAFEEQFEVKHRTDWPATHSKLYEVRTPATDLSIVVGAVGAPFAAMTMEELIACGATRFVSAGACGVLSPNIASPALILADSAIRDEGTSFHYLPPAPEIELDRAEVMRFAEMISERVGPPHVGKVWTTDGLYRETKTKLTSYRDRGVIAVEMEISALAAVARRRQVGYVGLLYALDNLSKAQASFPDATRKQLADKRSLARLISEYLGSDR